MSYLWVGLGSALGGMARYGLSGVMDRGLGETFPWGTLTVNVTGCLLIGFLAEVLGPDSRLMLPPTARQFLMIGICGGYTTFSSFGLQCVNQLRDGDWLHAGAYTFLSVVGCLLAVWLGMLAATHWTQLSGR